MLTFTFDTPAVVADSTLMQAAMDTVKQEKESGQIGYYLLPETSAPLVDEVLEYAKGNSLLSQPDLIKDIVVIGIGGSSLGVKALDSFLSVQNEVERLLWFVENSDPTDIARTFDMLERDSSLFIVISKSGSTIETTSAFKAAIAHFGLDLGGADRERVICITDEGSSLGAFADFHGIKQFNIPANVGGRFSVLSAVGVVPLTLAGYDVKSVLAGADALQTSFFKGDEEHLMLKAAFMAQQTPERGMNVLFSYANALDDFTKWYVQLWGESLGKFDRSGKRTGLTPIGQIGAVDQHSFLQLIIEGPHDKTVTFVNMESFGETLEIPDITLEHIEKTNFVNGHSFTELINAQCDATMQSVRQSGTPVDKITFSGFVGEDAGAFIMYYELLTSVVGAMLDVNTYDQPGVELGKKILQEKFNA